MALPRGEADAHERVAAEEHEGLEVAPRDGGPAQRRRVAGDGAVRGPQRLLADGALEIDWPACVCVCERCEEQK